MFTYALPQTVPNQQLCHQRLRAHCHRSGASTHAVATLPITGAWPGAKDALHCECASLRKVTPTSAVVASTSSYVNIPYRRGLPSRPRRRVTPSWRATSRGRTRHLREPNIKRRRHPRGHFPEILEIPGRQEVRAQGMYDKDPARTTRRGARQTRPPAHQDKQDTAGRSRGPPASARGAAGAAGRRARTARSRRGRSRDCRRGISGRVRRTSFQASSQRRRRRDE